MSIAKFVVKVMLFPLFLMVFTANMFVKMFVNLSGMIAGLMFLIGTFLIIFCFATHCIWGVVITFIGGIMISAVMLAIGFGEHLLDMAVELYQDF